MCIKSRYKGRTERGNVWKVNYIYCFQVIGSDSHSQQLYFSSQTPSSLIYLFFLTTEPQKTEYLALCLQPAGNLNFLLKQMLCFWRLNAKQTWPLQPRGEAGLRCPSWHHIGLISRTVHFSWRSEKWKKRLKTERREHFWWLQWWNRNYWYLAHGALKVSVTFLTFTHC